MVQPTRQHGLDESLPIGSAERTQLQTQLTPRIRHGGVASIRRRKTPRPFSAQAPVYLVLKSSRSKGGWNMGHRRNRSKILSMIYVYAERFKIHVYRASNDGKHLHLVVKAKERKNLQDYLRVLAGRVAITVTGAKKGKKKLAQHPHAPKNGSPKYHRKFWDFLFWSRLLNWGRDFFNVSQTVLQFSKSGGTTGVHSLNPQICEWEASEPRPPK